MDKFLKSLKLLRRSNSDCILGGVCGGLGKITDIPAWTWRVLFILLLLFTGVWPVVYILLWIFIPEEG